MRLLVGVAVCVVAACGNGGGTTRDGGTADAGPPEVLVAVAPQWRHDPIQLQFIPALDPATLTDESLVVTVDGVPQPRTVDVDITQDGQTYVTVRVAPSDTEAATPFTTVLTLTDTLRAPNGDAFPASSWMWSHEAWSAVDDEVPGATGESAPEFAISDDGMPVVIFGTGEPGMPGRLEVFYHERGRWTSGFFLNTTYLAEDYDVLFDSQGRTVVAVANPTDSGSVNHIVEVERHSSTGIDHLEGTMDMLPHVQPVDRLRLARDGDTIYFAWLYFTAIRVLRWNDATSEWNAVGQLTPINTVGDFDIAIDQGVPVLAYTLSSNPDGLHVARQAGGFSTWTELSAPIYKFLPTSVVAPRIVLRNNTAYVAWRENVGTGNHNLYAIRVALPGVTATDIDGPFELTAANDASPPALALAPDGRLYAAFTETSTSQSVVVRRLDGTSWQTIGQSLNPSTSGDARTVAIETSVHGHPFVLHGGARTPSAEVRLVRYND